MTTAIEKAGRSMKAESTDTLCRLIEEDIENERKDERQKTAEAIFKDFEACFPADYPIKHRHYTLAAIQKIKHKYLNPEKKEAKK